MITRTRVVALALCATFASVSPGSGQVLLYSLFERYIDSLRQQTGIPGMSLLIVKNGRVDWEGGFGHQDIEDSVAAAPDTPYPIGDLTQTLAIVLLRRVRRARAAQHRRPHEPLGGRLSDAGRNGAAGAGPRRRRALPLRSGPLRGSHDGGAELQSQAVSRQCRRFDPGAPRHGRFGAGTGPRHARDRRARAVRCTAAEPLRGGARSSRPALSRRSEPSRQPEQLPRARHQHGRGPRVHGARPGAVRLGPGRCGAAPPRDAERGLEPGELHRLPAADGTRMVRAELPG